MAVWAAAAATTGVFLWQVQTGRAALPRGLTLLEVTALMLIILAACLIGVLAHARCVRSSELRFDGEVWHLGLSDGQEIEGWIAPPALDFSFMMLLSFDAEAGGRHWLVLERARDPLQWTLLRATLYACKRRGQADQRFDASSQAVRP